MTPKHRLAELPRRSVRSLDPDVIARIFDGTPHLEPEVVRRQRSFVEEREGEEDLLLGVYTLIGALGGFALMIGLIAWVLL